MMPPTPNQGNDDDTTSRGDGSSDQQRSSRQQRRALHHRHHHHCHTRPSSLLVAAAIALLLCCLSSSPHCGVVVVLGSSSSRRFFGFRSAFRRPVGGLANTNRNHPINSNRRRRSSSSLPPEQQQQQYQRQQQQHRQQPSDRSSSSRLRLSTPPGDDDENEPTPSFNTTSLSSSSSSLSSSSSAAYNIHGRGAEEVLEHHQQHSVATTSFFRPPSETTEQQQKQELPRGIGIVPAFLQQLQHYSPPPSPKQHHSSFVSKRQQRPAQQQMTRHQIHATFVYSLMGLSGFVEGFFIRRHGCFPNLMTGTMLRLAAAVGNLELSTAVFYASMVGAYTAGGFIFALWKQDNNNDNSNDNTNYPNNNNNRLKHHKNLEAVAVLSSVFFVFSDFVVKSAKLPLLAVGFGILNAGTMDAGAGVTNAMTGHMTKIGQGFAGSKAAKTAKIANNNNKRSASSSQAQPPAHVASARGLAVFWTAALASNLLCGVLERSASGGAMGSASIASRLVQGFAARLPLGTTLAVAYGGLLRWYLGASARAPQENVAFA